VVSSIWKYYKETLYFTAYWRRNTQEQIGFKEGKYRDQILSIQPYGRKRELSFKPTQPRATPIVCSQTAPR
jgi:hypothetical protein